MDSYDLRGVLTAGLIKEDVLDRVIDASPTDMPLLSAISSSKVENSNFSWTLDRLQAPSTGGQVIDGSGGRADTSVLGYRAWNVAEIRVKNLQVSTRADAVGTIGWMRSMIYQLQQRGLELKRDVNATFLSANAGVVGTGSAAPVTCGLANWVTPFRLVPGSAGGAWSQACNSWVSAGSVASAGAGLNALTSTTPPFPATRTFATAVPANLSEQDIRTVANTLYVSGYNPTKLHSTPTVISLVSAYMFTSSARIATMINSGGDGSGARTAVGATNEFLTDFGTTLSFVADRAMNTTYTGGGAGTLPCQTAYIYDPKAMDIAVVSPLKSVELQTNGLFTQQELQWDLGLRVLDPHGVGAVFDIYDQVPMVAA